MAASKTATGEDAVRNYLKLVAEGPDFLVDAKEVERLTGLLSSTEDPIESLKVRQQLIDASEPDVDRVELEFVNRAQGWAHDAGVTGDAFKQMGVDSAVLRRAGFDVKGGKSRKSRTRASSTATTSSRTTQEDVISSIKSLKATFTLKQLQEITGASAGTARKAVQQCVSEGIVVEDGPDPDHDGAGRAPVLYSWVKK